MSCSTHATANPCLRPFGLAFGPGSAWESLTKRIADAKIVYETKGTVPYQYVALSICTDLRKTVENIIEKILLNKVVQRFTNHIKTMNVLIPISSMTKEDCELLDSFMTKYSFDLHSQPTQTPYQVPVPDAIKSDIETLKNWIGEYKQKLRSSN